MRWGKSRLSGHHRDVKATRGHAGSKYRPNTGLEIRKSVVFGPVRLRHWQIGQLPRGAMCAGRKRWSHRLLLGTTRPYGRLDKRCRNRSAWRLHDQFHQRHDPSSRLQFWPHWPPLFQYRDELVPPLHGRVVLLFLERFVDAAAPGSQAFPSPSHR